MFKKKKKKDVLLNLSLKELRYGAKRLNLETDEKAGSLGVVVRGAQTFALVY